MTNYQNIATIYDLDSPSRVMVVPNDGPSFILTEWNEALTVGNTTLQAKAYEIVYKPEVKVFQEYYIPLS